MDTPRTYNIVKGLQAMGMRLAKTDLTGAILQAQATLVYHSQQLERELAEANKRLAEAEKDAKRYRWLRVHSTQPAEGWSTHSNPESLDQAIDARIAHTY